MKPQGWILILKKYKKIYKLKLFFTKLDKKNIEFLKQYLLLIELNHLYTHLLIVQLSIRIKSNNLSKIQRKYELARNRRETYFNWIMMWSLQFALQKKCIKLEKFNAFNIFPRVAMQLMRKGTQTVNKKITTTTIYIYI